MNALAIDQSQAAGEEKRCILCFCLVGRGHAPGDGGDELLFRDVIELPQRPLGSLGQQVMRLFDRVIHITHYYVEQLVGHALVPIRFG